MNQEFNEWSHEDQLPLLRKTSAPSSGGFSSTLPLAIFVTFCNLILLLMVIGETSDPTSMGFEETPASQQELPINNQIAIFFTPEILYWQNEIIKWAQEWELDPNLVATVMQIESCGDPLAKSYAGALGLFQVMPYHFQFGEMPFNPNTNAKRGLSYLRNSIDSHLSPRLALAGYNGGISTASKPESLWPKETVRYVYWGENIYQDTLEGNSESIYLNEWLESGGASLCAQARERLGLIP